LIGYLEYLGAHHPKAFAGLLAKMLPLQVNADVNNAVVGAINVVSIPRDRFLSMAELEKFRPALEIEHAPQLEQREPEQFEDSVEPEQFEDPIEPEPELTPEGGALAGVLLTPAFDFLRCKCWAQKPIST
jgi:hypothetical protein